MREADFTTENRKKLVADIYQLRARIEGLMDNMENHDEDEGMLEGLGEEYDNTMFELEELSKTYMEGLERFDVSRCPFTGATYHFSCDTRGLDGPWWDAKQPLRPIEEQTDSFIALTGSVNIIGETPDIPFMVKPGPAVPWVCPRLLENEDICAVLSHIKIGMYDAYVVVYYSEDRSYEIERINSWGTETYLAEDQDGAGVMGSTFDESEEYDFNIAPWIERGKLKWISIGDRTLELQDRIDNCPYIDLEGYQYPVLLRNKTMENCLIELEYLEDDTAVMDGNEINFCPDCGTNVAPNNNFCAKCGFKLH